MPALNTPVLSAYIYHIQRITRYRIFFTEILSLSIIAGAIRWRDKQPAMTGTIRNMFNEQFLSL